MGIADAQDKARLSTKVFQTKLSLNQNVFDDVKKQVIQKKSQYEEQRLKLVTLKKGWIQTNDSAHDEIQQHNSLREKFEDVKRVQQKKVAELIWKCEKDAKNNELEKLLQATKLETLRRGKKIYDEALQEENDIFEKISKIQKEIDGFAQLVETILNSDLEDIMNRQPRFEKEGLNKEIDKLLDNVDGYNIIDHKNLLNDENVSRPVSQDPPLVQEEKIITVPASSVESREDDLFSFYRRNRAHEIIASNNDKEREEVNLREKVSETAKALDGFAEEILCLKNDITSREKHHLALQEEMKKLSKSSKTISENVMAPDTSAEEVSYSKHIIKSRKNNHLGLEDTMDYHRNHDSIESNFLSQHIRIDDLESTLQILRKDLDDRCNEIRVLQKKNKYLNDLAELRKEKVVALQNEQDNQVKLLLELKMKELIVPPDQVVQVA